MLIKIEKHIFNSNQGTFFFVIEIKHHQIGRVYLSFNNVTWTWTHTELC